MYEEKNLSSKEVRGDMSMSNGRGMSALRHTYNYDIIIKIKAQLYPALIYFNPPEIEVTVSGACKDKEEGCAAWAADNYCVTQRDLMSYYCVSTCGFCDVVKEVNLATVSLKL